MKIVADLHIHGPHSRATSRDTSIKNLEKYARVKGLGLLGTGDFTHPAWLNALRESLSEDGTGILKTSSGFSFILSAEISNVYEHDRKTRKVHNVLLARDFETAVQINEFLSKHGSLSADGRPTFAGMPCPELVESLISISRDIVVIPAHAWTPWFGIFGSKSGFDSVEECFQDQAKHIFAIETGLSSDPPMNWRLSSLDRFALVSNSDAHSYWPWRIGREANAFDLKKVNYDEIISAIKERDRKRFLYTVEVDPSYGKYHLDGHRDCRVCMEPSESLKIKKTCPVCRRQLTIGVMHRVEELADRPHGFVPKGAIPFRSLIPLTEIIAAVLGTDQLYSKKIWEEYDRLIKAFGSEFSVLLDAEKDEMLKVASEAVTGAVLKIREGKIRVRPGYDGIYGKLLLDEKEKAIEASPQKNLRSFCSAD